MAVNLAQLEHALRRLDERDLLFTHDGAHWRRLRLTETGETATRAITIGATTYTTEVAVTAPRDAGPVTFDTRAAAPPPPPRPVLGERLGWHVRCGERIACNSCDGAGTSGRPTICGCVSDVHRAVHLTDGDTARDPDDLANFELDATRPDHAVAAARRARHDCVRCDGTAVVSLPCWNCRGIGWFWPTHTLTLTGVAGVATVELTPSTLAPYVADTGTRRGDVATARVALADALVEHCAGVAGPGPWMLLGDRAGDAQLLDEWSAWHTSEIDATHDAYLQWFGRTFGLAAAIDPGAPWPPHEAPAEAPPGHTHLSVATAPDDAALLAELVADGPICCGRTFIATGQTGPVIYRCDDDGRPVATLALDYHLSAAAIAALDVVRRS